VIAVDTNVLIATHRSEHPKHEAAVAALKAIAEGDAPWALPVFCLAEFVRVVTHPKVFSPPTGLETSLLFIDRLLESPGVRLLTPADRYWPLLRQAFVDADATGNLAFDAQIASVCVEHGAERLLTEDRDFARFPGVEPVRLVDLEA
jgi:uncharacterized protein